MIFILLLTIFTRSVTVRYCFTVYARGLFLGVGITLLIGAIYRLLGFDPANDFFAYAIFFPIVEEICKILPVILSAWLIYRSRKVQFNISDWLALGMMAGAALGMSEDYYRTGVFGDHYGPHIGNVYLFPDALGGYFDRDYSLMGYVGHGAGTAFIAIAIGLGFYLSKKLKKNWLKWQVPLVAFIWITFEHMANNARAESSIMIKIFNLVGGGMWTPWIMLVLMLAGISLDANNFARVYKEVPRFKELAQYGVKKVRGYMKEKTWPPFSFMKGCFNALRFLNRYAWNYFSKN